MQGPTSTAQPSTAMSESIGLQPSSDDGFSQVEIHRYTEIAFRPSTAQPDLTATVPCQESSVDAETSSTGTAALPNSVGADVHNSSQSESLTLTTSPPKVTPYAEVSILPTTAQPNLTAVEEEPGDCPCPRDPFTAPPESPIMEDNIQHHDINPYAEITIQPQPTIFITSSTPVTNTDHSMDPTATTDDVGQSRRRMSLNPRHFYSSSSVTSTPETKEVQANLTGNRSRRRLSLGARLFLKTTPGTQSSSQRSGAVRRRLSLGIRNYHRAAPSPGGENDKQSGDLVDLLTGLRSNGVSFQTDNPAGPRLRKNVTEVELGRGGSFHGRRRMTMGAQLFRRPLLTTESSTDGGSRRRRMSVGARFLRRAVASDTAGATSDTNTRRRRMSLGARLFSNRHRSRTKSEAGHRLGRFLQKVQTVSEDSSSVAGGETINDGAVTDSEAKKSGRRMSLGARLLHKLKPPGAPSRSAASSMLSMNVESTKTCHEEEATSSSGSELDSSVLTELLEILRSSGVSFSTNRILEARERARSPPPPPPPPLRVRSENDLRDCQ